MNILTYTYKNHIDVKVTKEYKLNSTNTIDPTKDETIPFLFLTYLDGTSLRLEGLQLDTYVRDNPDKVQEITFKEEFGSASVLNFLDWVNVGNIIISKVLGNGEVHSDKNSSISLDTDIVIKFSLPVYKVDMEVMASITSSESDTLVISKYIEDLQTLRILRLSNMTIKKITCYTTTTNPREIVEYCFHGNIYKDGWITALCLFLPTEKWVEKNFDKITLLYDYIYFVTEEYKVIKWIALSNTFNYVDVLEEIIKINPSKSNIEICTCDLVSIWNLQNCYVNLCKHIFDQSLIRCKNKDSTESEYHRDILWMAISVIRYLTEIHSCDINTLYTILGIIDDISRCGNICNKLKPNHNGCGCSKT